MTETMIRKQSSAIELTTAILSIEILRVISRKHSPLGFGVAELRISLRDTKTGENLIIIRDIALAAGETINIAEIQKAFEVTIRI